MSSENNKNENMDIDGDTGDEPKEDEDDKAKQRAKLAELREFVPTLQALILKCPKDPSVPDSKEICHSRLKKLHNLLTNPKIRLPMASLKTCETILSGISKRMKLQTKKLGGSPTTPRLPSPHDNETIQTSRPSTSKEGLLNPPFKEIGPSSFPSKNLEKEKKDNFTKTESFTKNNLSTTYKTSNKVLPVVPRPRHTLTRYDSPPPPIMSHIPIRVAGRNNVPVRLSNFQVNYRFDLNCRSVAPKPVQLSFNNEPQGRYDSPNNYFDLRSKIEAKRATHAQDLNTISLSPDVKLDVLDSDVGKTQQKDEDTLSLEHSQRKLEALMQNRLASINANKMLVTSINKDIPTQVPDTADETVSPFSSTLDQVMFNLNARFRGKRVLPKNTQKDEENIASNLSSLNFANPSSPLPGLSSMLEQTKTISSTFVENTKECEPSKYSNKCVTNTVRDINFQSVSDGQSHVTNTSKTNIDSYTLSSNCSVKPDQEDRSILNEKCIVKTKEQSCKTKDSQEISDTAQENKTSQNLEAEIANIMESVKLNINKKNTQTINSETINKSVNVKMLASSEQTHYSQTFKERLHEEYSDMRLGSQEKSSEDLDTKKANQVLFPKASNEADSSKSITNLRSKLSEEISTLHKIGTPCGGALRGLINRDKMMPPGRIASLKPGTLIDLIQEEKPQRSHHKIKAKPNPQANFNTGNSTNLNMMEPSNTLFGSSESKQPSSSPSQLTARDLNNILAKISENDLKKLINENIEDLPTPPALSIFSNVVGPENVYNKEVNVQSSANQTWNNSNSMQQINFHSQNIVINNIGISPIEYKNSTNTCITSHQNTMNMPWSSNNTNDSWRNISPPKDPRRDSQNVPMQNISYNNSHHNFDIGNKTLATAADLLPQPFEKPSYSSSKKIDAFKYTEGVALNDPGSYNPPLLQSDPLRSPCYDGSTTPDQKILDPFHLEKIQDNREKNESTYNTLPITSKCTQRPSHLGAPAMHYDPDTVQRPSLLRTPPIRYDLDIQRPSLLGSSDIGQRPSLLGTPPVQNDIEAYRMYPDNHQLRYGNPVSGRNVGPSYSVWRTEKNIPDIRNSNQSQVHDNGTTYYDRATDDRNNYMNKYRWSRDTANTNRYDQQHSRDYGNWYRNDNSATPSRPAYKDPDVPKKMSARDPRRKSIDENIDRKFTDMSSNVDRDKTGWSLRRDPRVKERTPSLDRGRSRENAPSRDRARSREKTPLRDREKTPLRDRGRSIEKTYSRDRGRSRERSREKTLSRDRGRSTERSYSHERSSSRGRTWNPDHDKSRYKNSRSDKSYRDSYSSPLDDLYSNVTTPKTGLGYGFQKYRIPKLTRSANDQSTKNVKDAINDNTVNDNGQSVKVVQTGKDLKNINSRGHKLDETNDELSDNLEQDNDKSLINSEISNEHILSEAESVEETTSKENLVNANTIEKPENNQSYKSKCRVDKLYTNSLKSEGIDQTETTDDNTCTLKKGNSPLRRRSSRLNQLQKESIDVDKSNLSSNTCQNLIKKETVDFKSDLNKTNEERELEKNGCKLSDGIKSANELLKESLGNNGNEDPILYKNVLNDTSKVGVQLLLSEDGRNIENVNRPDILPETHSPNDNLHKQNPSDVITLENISKPTTQCNVTQEVCVPITTKSITSIAVTESDNEKEELNQIKNDHALIIKPESNPLQENITPSNEKLKELTLTSKETLPHLESIEINEQFNNGDNSMDTSDCAIDLSVKKNSEDELITDTSLYRRKTINNPPTVLSQNKPCDSTLVLDKTSNKCIQGSEMPTNRSLNTDHEVKLKTQITPELIHDVFGVTLSPDKLRKMAELIADVQLKKEVDRESELNYNEENQCVQISSTETAKIDSKMSTKESISEIEHDEIHLKELGEGCSKSIKVKVNKKKKKTKSKTPSVPLEDIPPKKDANPKRRRKYKNELDRLQDDISKYHDSEAIAAASGLRLCRLQKEKNQNSVILQGVQAQQNGKEKVQHSVGVKGTPQAQQNAKKKLVDKKMGEVKETFRDASPEPIKAKEESPETGEEKEKLSVPDEAESSESYETGEEDPSEANEEQSEQESDPYDFEPLRVWTEKLKSKYEPIIMENEARLERQRKLKLEEKTISEENQTNIKENILSISETKTTLLDKNIANNECVSPSSLLTQDKKTPSFQQSNSETGETFESPARNQVDDDTRVTLSLSSSPKESSKEISKNNKKSEKSSRNDSELVEDGAFESRDRRQVDHGTSVAISGDNISEQTCIEISKPNKQSKKTLGNVNHILEDTSFESPGTSKVELEDTRVIKSSCKEFVKENKKHDKTLGKDDDAFESSVTNREEKYADVTLSFANSAKESCNKISRKTKKLKKVLRNNNDLPEDEPCKSSGGNKDAGVALSADIISKKCGKDISIENKPSEKVKEDNLQDKKLEPNSKRKVEKNIGATLSVSKISNKGCTEISKDNTNVEMALGSDNNAENETYESPIRNKITQNNNVSISSDGLKKSSNILKMNNKSEKVPRKEISSNILHKYGIKKQKKKSFWKAGIIKKKSKRKKTQNLLNNLHPPVDTNEDDLEMDNDFPEIGEEYETDVHNNDGCDNQLADINYYQERELKATKCKLCPYSGKAIVSHYAITHPKDEVLISRMSPRESEQAVKESLYFFSLKGEELTTDKFKCRICYLNFSKFSMFFEHMALHTGEFRHECCTCGYRTSTRSGITKHSLTHNWKSTTKGSCRVLYPEPSDKSFFCGFLCSLCNFFQISQSNVKRHIENNHENQNCNIIKINLSKLSYDDSKIYGSESENFMKAGTSSESQLFLKCNDSNMALNESSPEPNSSNGRLSINEGKIQKNNTDESSACTNVVDTKIKPHTPSISIYDSAEKYSDFPNSKMLKDDIPKVYENALSESPDEDKVEKVIVKPQEIVEGCFEISPKMDNHVDFIETEVRNSYIKKCEEAVDTIKNQIHQSQSSGFVDELASKLVESEITPEKIYALESLIGTKKKLQPSMSIGNEDEKVDHNTSEKTDEVLPLRRQLPERSCKGIQKLKEIEKLEKLEKFEEEELDINDDQLSQFFEGLDEPGSEISKDLLPTISEFNHFNQDRAQLLYDNQVERCQQAITSKRIYEPVTKVYVSCLPNNSNLSEFTHVMKQISHVTLKSLATTEISVGELKIMETEDGIMFSCTVKEFKKTCEYQTYSLEAFGHHINVSHHLSYWDGTCGLCFVMFLQDPKSHDKANIYTQSKAFCHLVREHLTFSKKANKAPSRGCYIKEVPEEPPQRPMLRVRRLSGDKLSIPGPDTENSLPQPHMEVAGYSDSILSITKSGGSEQSNNNVLPSDIMPEKLVDLYEGLQLPDYQPNNANHISVKPVANYKTVAAYQSMLTHTKLRHFYKCMGIDCSFTTVSSKDFAIHYDRHNEECAIDFREDVNKNFKRCPYCLAYLETSREFLVHARKEHGECLYQCALCFYRSKSIANILFHHNTEHPQEKFCVLECAQCEINLPPFIERPFTDFVLAFRCSRDGCTLFTYMMDTFCHHLLSNHKNDFTCHLCCQSSPTLKKICQHYLVEHGIGLYQCLYCIHATTNERDMRTHLCYKHPGTVPKAIHRIDSGGRRNEPQLPGTMNRECLRRVVFHKDQDKLLKYVIPLPPVEKPSDGVRNSNTSNTIPPVQSVISARSTAEQNILCPVAVTTTLSPSRPVIFKGISPSKRPASKDTNVHPAKIFILNGDTSASSSGGINLVPLYVTCVSSSKVSVTSPPQVQKVLSLSPRTTWSVTSSAKITPVSISGSSLGPLNIQNAAKLTDSVRLSVITSVASPIVPSTTTVVSFPTAKTSTSTVHSQVGSSYSTAPAKNVNTASLSMQPRLTAKLESSSNVSTVSNPVSQTETQPSSQKGLEVNYFKCGNKDCKFESSSSTTLKTHLVICDHARQSQKLLCFYCKRNFKQVTSFIDHLRIHGPNRFSCSLCNYKAPVQSRLNSHMKIVHHITSIQIIPVDSMKRDYDKDLFIVTAKEKRGRGSDRTSIKGVKGKSDGVKTKFTQADLDEIPKAAIFQFPLGCSLCVYETKVRSNLIRHIEKHASGDNVCQEEVVNPVPNKTEKMFDKMMNLAGSSHTKASAEGDEIDIPPQFRYVDDQLRYMCHVKECGYRTISDTMLRDHIMIIHKDEINYECPHCPEDKAIIPISMLGLHLKMHDSPLFRCGHCAYYSHIRRNIEGHQIMLHSQQDLSVKTVRMFKQAQRLPEQPVVSLVKPGSSEEPVKEAYICTMCNFKTQKKKLMMSHGSTAHQMAKPFKCSLCNYDSNTETIFSNHFKTYHPEQEAECHVVSLFKKVTEVKQPVLVSIPPLWRRDTNRIKSIRGITLDEKGDAPPPVATCVSKDVSELDILELKLGSFGEPAPGGQFVCPRCLNFQVKNKLEMKEHLFKDFDYKPIACKICNLSSTQKSKITKHISKIHNIDNDQVDSSMEININQDIEDWVEKVLATQQELMKRRMDETTELVSPLILSRKRRRSSSAETEVNVSLLPSTSSAGMEQSNSDENGASCSTVSNTDSWNCHKKDSNKPDASAGVVVPVVQQDVSSEAGERRVTRFCCRYCDVKSKYKKSIIVHSTKNHPNLPPLFTVSTTNSPTEERPEVFNCMHCNCISLTLSDLNKHWTLSHKLSGLGFTFKKGNFSENSKRKEFNCFWCKKRSELQCLEEHHKLEHSDQPFLFVSVMVPKYKCSECKLIFNSVDILKKHFSMDHPSKEFCYVVINTHKPICSGDGASPSVQTEVSKQNSTKYKCFNCHFVSSLFCLMVKHLHRHFITYVCPECDSLYPSAMGIRSHMHSKHPGSELRPLILKGSDRDIENAKRNVIIVSESGAKRKISEEELIRVEEEEKSHEQKVEPCSQESETQNKPLPKVKGTARKSTSFIRQHTKSSLHYPSSPEQRSSSPRQHDEHSPQHLQRLSIKQKKALYKVKRKTLTYSDVFVTLYSRGKNIKLPGETLQKLINFEAELSLDQNALLQI